MEADDKYNCGAFLENFYFFASKFSVVMSCNLSVKSMFLLQLNFLSSCQLYLKVKARLEKYSIQA